jgi:adenylate kinase family enzyme
MKRIVIVGTSGCGKTTLGKRLSNILGISYFDLDEYYWLPGWQAKNIKDFENTVRELTCHKTWIISGNYSNIRDLIWSRGSLIIWLDYSIFRCLYQGLSRSIKQAITKETFCNGNYESFARLFFSRYSILLWIITTFLRRRKTYNNLFTNKEGDKVYLRFSNPCETNNWLKNVSKQT